MNEFERVQLHPHLHGLVAVYGDFFHVIFRAAAALSAIVINAGWNCRKS